MTEWLGGIYYHGHVCFGVGVPYFDSILVGYAPSTKVVAGTVRRRTFGCRCPAWCT